MSKYKGARYPQRPTAAACAAAYQIAGSLLLAGDELTDGQRERSTELLLDFLSEPGRYTGKTLTNLHRMALKP